METCVRRRMRKATRPSRCWIARTRGRGVEPIIRRRHLLQQRGHHSYGLLGWIPRKVEANCLAHGMQMCCSKWEKKTSIVDPGLQDREKEGLKTKMNAVERHNQLRNNVFLISNGPCGCVAAKILLPFLMLNNGKANTTIHVGL